MTLLTEPTRIVLAKGQPVPNDPSFAFNSLLLHGDGTNGSTTITDSSPSPKTVTAAGNAQISTAQSKFGGASIVFNGSGDTLSIDNFNGFEDAFTCELFFRPAQFLSFSALVLLGTINTSNSFALATNASGNALFRLGSATSYLSSSTVNLDQWFHVAVSRDTSNVCRLFVNGSLEASATISNTLSAAQLRTGTFPVDGYIDELRITKGVARYTANFTPPTAPFPDF